MDFANERWVKLYTRDTASWVALSWPARNLLIQLLRKVDRAGCIDLGRVGMRALAGMLGAADHRAEIESSLRELVEDGAVELVDDGARLVIPNFVAAQETRMSASARAKLSRDKKKAGLPVTKRDASVTKRDGEEAQPTVTKRDATVTPRDASATPRDEVPRTGATDGNVTKRDGNVTPRDATVTKRDSRLLNRTEQNRTEGGERARDAHAPAHPRAHAREETPPAPDPRDEDRAAIEEALLGGVDRAPGRWVDAGKPWQRTALLDALLERGIDEREANALGRYLASGAAIERERTSAFSFDWFVFGSQDAPEFKRLDGVLRRAREWNAGRSAPPRVDPPTTQPSRGESRNRSREIVEHLRHLKAQGATQGTDADTVAAGDALVEALGGDS